MRARSVPERVPVTDAFNGVIVQGRQAQALALSAPPGLDVVASGEFLIQYGVRFLGKPQTYIVPGLVVLDYGDLLTGEDGWNFLWHRHNLHPRAEVAGYRDDGRDDLVFFRQLDLSIPPQVLVYRHSDFVTPLARPTAFIGDVPTDLPSRLREYLPVHRTAADWETAS
jgi:hypothetical protein